MRGLKKLLVMLIPALPGEGGRHPCHDAASTAPTATPSRSQAEQIGRREAPLAHAFPAWRAFGASYPRLAAGMALATAALLSAVMVLICKGIGYDRELSQLESSVFQAHYEGRTVLEALERSRAAIGAEETRRAARGDRRLHLALDRSRGILILEREGAVLREMRVRIGPEAVVEGDREPVRLAPPLGKRLVARVEQQGYRWAPPEWLFVQRGEPVPEKRGLAGGLGPLALILDQGAIIYTLPDTGPLSDPDYVMPGSVLVKAADMEAIRGSLRPGLAVYCY